MHLPQLVQSGQAQRDLICHTAAVGRGKPSSGSESGGERVVGGSRRPFASRRRFAEQVFDRHDFVPPQIEQLITLCNKRMTHRASPGHLLHRDLPPLWILGRRAGDEIEHHRLALGTCIARSKPASRPSFERMRS